MKMKKDGIGRGRHVVAYIIMIVRPVRLPSATHWCSRPSSHNKGNSTAAASCAVLATRLRKQWHIRLVWLRRF